MDLLERDPGERPSGEEILRRLGGMAGEASRMAAQRRLFVGRESQLAALNAAFTDMCQGRTVAVFVHGRSGVGKSSLIQRFLEGLFERGEAVILAGRCYEQESVAYKAVDTLIDCALALPAPAVPARGRRPHSSGCVDAGAGFSRIAAGRGGGRSPDAVPTSFPTSSSCGGGRSPRCASCSRASATAGRSCWPSTISNGVTWTAPSCCQTCCARPIAPVLLLVGSYRSEYATLSPFLRVLLQQQSDGSAPRDHREVALEPLTLAEGRELALRLIGQDDPAGGGARRDHRPRVGGQSLLRLRAGGIPQGRRRAGRRRHAVDPLQPGQRARTADPQAAGGGREPAGGPGRRGPAACVKRSPAKPPTWAPPGFPGWRCCGPSIWSEARVWDRSTRWKPTTTGSGRRWSTIWTPIAGAN